MTRPSLFLFAGEMSGDRLGSGLMRALREELPHLVISGVGGPSMRKEELQSIGETEQFCDMGIQDVLLSLPKIVKNFRKVRRHILEKNPDAVILIDYQEFNMRLAASLRKKGYKGKIVQYVSPSVWAWRPGRAATLAKNLDKLLTIYPFEAACYAHTSLPVEYIGNPVKQRVSEYRYENGWMERLNIPESERLVALFPGSRRHELERNLPLQLTAAKILKKEDPERVFAISSAHEALTPLLIEKIKKARLEPGKGFYIVPDRYAYELMRGCRSAIATSGTVNLELALHHCPTVVTYDISAFNRFVGSRVLRLNLPHYSIVNILLKRELYPELIESGIPPELVARSASLLDAEGDERQRCLAGCREMESLLLSVNSGERAAKAVAQLL